MRNRQPQRLSRSGGAALATKRLRFLVRLQKYYWFGCISGTFVFKFVTLNS